ncbi:MAG: hypothetical protein FIA92_02345 [Chloroflexi bacterium]|nr:hypothetical protein [Chloroflexota bacterium]
MSGRRLAALAVTVLVAGPLLLAYAALPRSPEDRAAEADALVAGIRASVATSDSSLLATRAVADFGVEEGVRLVLVRIVDQLTVEVRVESPIDVWFEPPVVACLVGPDAAPDAAGLEDRCWGEGSLGQVIAAGLVRDEDGHLGLVAGTPVTVSATFQRGDVRCDYPPGAWYLELRVDPIVDGQPAGPRYAQAPTFEVPFVPDQPLQLVMERRYCGLASKVYREQGEPVVASD